MEEKILTLHPEGKRGVHLSREKYEAMKAALLDALRDTPGLTYTGLVEAVERRLQGEFPGSIPWHAEVVKLDLEAREVVQRITEGKRETYELTASDRGD